MAKSGGKMILCLFFCAIIISSTATNCTFPASMAGTWLSSSHGTWMANSTVINGINFKLSYSTPASPVPTSFSCMNRKDNLYVIESVAKFSIFGINDTLKTCIDLREISSAKFVYYIAKAPDSNQDILTFNAAYEKICDSSDYNASYAHHVLLKNGSESDGFILCPPSIYGTYSYNDSCMDPMYNTTNVNVCTTRQQLVFNYNACSTPLMYSQEGILNCVYYITNGSISYLTVYNSDSTTPNEINYYRFSCIILDEINHIVYLTAKAKGCEASQNANYVNNGEKMVWRPYAIELVEKQGDLIWIAIVVAVVVALVILIIVTSVIARCIRRRQQRKADEEKPITEETSVDENSIEKDAERKSIDSGISETSSTRRNNEDREHIVSTVVKVDVDDNSRPTIRKEISRMSDLPPSTIPQDGTPTPDDEEQVDDPEDKMNKSRMNQQELFYDVEREDRDGRKSIHANNSLEKDDTNKLEGCEHKLHDLHQSFMAQKNETSQTLRGASKVIDVKEADLKRTVSLESLNNEIIQRNKKRDNSSSYSEKVGVSRDEDNHYDHVNQNDHQVNFMNHEKKGIDPEKYKEAKCKSENYKTNDHAGTTNDNAEDQQSEGGNVSVIKDSTAVDYGDEGNVTTKEPMSVSKSEESLQNEYGDETLKGTLNAENDRSKMRSSLMDKAVIQNGAISKLDSSNRCEHEKENKLTENDGGKSSSSSYVSGYSEHKKETRRDEKDKRSDSVDRNVSEREKEKARGVETGKYGINKAKMNDETNQKNGEDNIVPSHIESDGSNDRNEDKEDEDRDGPGGGDEITSDSDDKKLTPEQSRYQPKEPLTKTLMSRKDDERKRQSKGKDKKKKLRKLGKKKLKNKIGKGVEEGEGGQEGDGSESGSFDSEEEGNRIDGAVIAPFTKQYKYKKHIEHVLEEEHNLSDEDNRDKADNFNDLNTFSPSAAIVLLVAEEKGVMPALKVQKTGSDADGDSDVSQAQDAAKLHSNSDTDDTVKREEKHDGTDRKDTRKAKGEDDVAGTHKVTVKDKTQSSCEPQDSDVNDISKKETTLIHIRDSRQTKRKGRKTTIEDGEESYDSCSTETDSGVGDEDETHIDLQLTKDQQEFIYKNLHDEHSNLRPVFERNAEGKIIRKSDGAVVFDPHSGKVRIRKQIGNIFSIPRLKRNKNGRLIGGYHDDPFGPTKQKEVEAEIAALDDSIDNNSISGKHSSSSGRTSNARSACNPNKEDKIRTKTVVFDVRDEVEVMQMDNSELSELRRKGRRDITSAIRKKLRDRLFRRRNKRGGATPNDLPVSGKMKQAWVQSDSISVQEKTEVGEGHGIGGEHVQLKPLVRMQIKHGPQWSSGTPLRSSVGHGAVPYHRSVGGGSIDPKHQRIFQQGLKTDKKVLYSLNEHMDANKHNMQTGLHANNDGHDRTAGEKKDEDYDEVSQTRNMGSGNSLLEDKERYKDIQGSMVRRTGLNSTRLNNDYRLRILLEELFRDKKYFDRFIETTDPNSDMLVLTKSIAEYGREFLLERAEFWEEREPIPPRPPPTQYGFSMSRAHTSLQEDINSTSTVTPDLRPHTMPTNLPGYVSDEEQSSKANIQDTEYVGKNEKESYV